MIDANTGWMLGGIHYGIGYNFGLLMYTSDGISWGRVVTTGMYGHFDSIAAPDANHGIALGCPNYWEPCPQIYDGAWSPFEFPVTRLGFADQNNGWAVGAIILHTTTGGR